MNKRGSNILMENIVFILLVLVFIAAMYFAIVRTGSLSTLSEQVFSKQIALIIDKAKPGMEIEVDLFEGFVFARKNKFSGNIVTIENIPSKVNVKLIQGRGYDSYYFNDVNIEWDLVDERISDKKCLSKTTGCLKLKFIEKNE